MALSRCKKSGGGTTFPEIEQVDISGSVSTININTNENETLLFALNIYSSVTSVTGGTILASGYNNIVVIIKPTSNLVTVTISNANNSQVLYKIKKKYDNATVTINTSNSTQTITNKAKDNLIIAMKAKGYTCIAAKVNQIAVYRNITDHLVAIALDDTNELTVSFNSQNNNVFVLS